MKSAFPSGLEVGNFASGGVIAIVAILMVFVVLLAIIVITELVGKLINNATKNELAPATANAAPVAQVVRQQLNLNDEDAVVAALVASIDYRNETNKNIQVVSVKEVK